MHTANPLTTAYNSSRVANPIARFAGATALILCSLLSNAAHATRSQQKFTVQIVGQDFADKKNFIDSNGAARLRILCSAIHCQSITYIGPNGFNHGKVAGLGTTAEYTSWNGNTEFDKAYALLSQATPNCPLTVELGLTKEGYVQLRKPLKAPRCAIVGGTTPSTTQISIAPQDIIAACKSVVKSDKPVNSAKNSEDFYEITCAKAALTKKVSADAIIKQGTRCQKSLESFTGNWTENDDWAAAIFECLGDRGFGNFWPARVRGSQRESSFKEVNLNLPSPILVEAFEGNSVGVLLNDKDEILHLAGINGFKLRLKSINIVNDLDPTSRPVVTLADEQNLDELSLGLSPSSRDLRSVLVPGVVIEFGGLSTETKLPRLLMTSYHRDYHSFSLISEVRIPNSGMEKVHFRMLHRGGTRADMKPGLLDLKGLLEQLNRFGLDFEVIEVTI